MFCTNCGKPLRDDARFCPNCGQAVVPLQPTPQPEPESLPDTPPVGSVSEAPVPEPPVPEAPVPEAPAPEAPAPEAPAPEPPVPEAPAPKAPAPETSAPETSAPRPPIPNAPPPPPPPRAPGKRRVLPVVIAAVVVLLLAAVGVLAFLFLSNNRAFDASMAAGASYMDEGDYDMAVSAFEDALERKPKDTDAALALVKAYLCDGRFSKAGELLNSMPSLDEDDERLSAWETLTGLTWLEPEVEDVDASAFPTVTVTLRQGSDLELTPDQFTLTENGTAREITELEQSGRTVRLTYRSEDTDVSEEHRELELTIDVDGVIFRDDASYSTPYFEPAQLTLVSTDVSEYPKVKAYFRVSNAVSGENVDGLTANSFTILERVQGGEYLAREVSSAVPLKDHAGLNIDLVADKSDSISIVDMNKIKTVMIEFVNSLQYDVGDKAELLAFDSIVQQMCAYTGDVTLLTNGINNMSTDGMTAFYDAVYDGVTNAALQGGARCVIAFTDGLDNMSRRTANEVVSYANSKQVPVYIIGVSQSVEESTLRAMAQNTGGRYWYIDDLYDLQEIFDQIYSEQKELYVVEYESDASLDSYLARDLSVQVSGGGCRANADLSFTPVPSINDSGVSHTSRYQLFKESLSWEEASRRCQELGGHLATITSQDEMDLLVGMATDAGAKYVWLGGYTSYDDYGNVFGHWVTGEDFSYQAWSADEPSRVDLDGTEEWYIMLWDIPSLGGWTWNDQRNDPAAAVASMADEMAFICEFED